MFPFSPIALGVGPWSCVAAHPSGSPVIVGAGRQPEKFRRDGHNSDRVEPRRHGQRVASQVRVQPRWELPLRGQRRHQFAHRGIQRGGWHRHAHAIAGFAVRFRSPRSGRARDGQRRPALRRQWRVQRPRPSLLDHEWRARRGGRQPVLFRGDRGRPTESYTPRGSTWSRIGTDNRVSVLRISRQRGRDNAEPGERFAVRHRRGT